MSKSILMEYRELEDKLNEIQAKKDELAPSVKTHMEFLNEIKAKADEVGISYEAIAHDLAPNLFVSQAPAAKQRRGRRTKTYLNPHTNETVQTKGGNHKVLKAWKQEHGHEEVESWVTDHS